MKRTLTGLLVAVMTFAGGTAILSSVAYDYAYRVTKAEPRKVIPHCPLTDEAQQILDADYCEVMRDPDRYDGRILRLEAIFLADPNYSPAHDRVMMGEPRCDRMLMVNDGFHLASRTCPEVMGALDALLTRHDPEYPRKNAKVTVVGKFLGPRETTLDSGKHFWESERFSVISIEKARSVDDE